MKEVTDRDLMFAALERLMIECKPGGKCGHLGFAARVLFSGMVNIEKIAKSRGHEIEADKLLTFFDSLTLVIMRCRSLLVGAKLSLMESETNEKDVEKLLEDAMKASMEDIDG